jgi:hypothetical protein
VGQGMQCNQALNLGQHQDNTALQWQTLQCMSLQQTNQ